MFEQKLPDPEAIARLSEDMERCYPSTTAESSALLDGIGGFWRLENRAVAAQLGLIGELFAYRLSRCSENEDWAIDTMAAVGAEVGAALRISQDRAQTLVGYARAMRERLPRSPRCSPPGISIIGRFRRSCTRPI